jgi:hypothetical protein
MSRMTPTSPVQAPSRFFQRLCAILQMRIHLQCQGARWRLALEPPVARRAVAIAPGARPSRRPRLPPLPGSHAVAARYELRLLLDHVPAARRVWPSLALLERVLGSGNSDDLHRVEAAVLRHAARSLDQLGDELYGPGLVVLRRRVELVLRRKHGDRPSHWVRMPPPVSPEQATSFGNSLTDYIDMDRVQITASRALQHGPASTVGSGAARRESAGGVV